MNPQTTTTTSGPAAAPPRPGPRPVIVRRIVVDDQEYWTLRYADVGFASTGHHRTPFPGFNHNDRGWWTGRSLHRDRAAATAADARGE